MYLEADEKNLKFLISGRCKQNMTDYAKHVKTVRMIAMSILEVMPKSQVEMLR
jgi:hypothetical protein